MPHWQIHLKFTLSFIWASHPPAHIFSLSAANAKLCEHLQLPLSLCLTLPPTSAVAQGPPAPPLFSQALGVTSALWPGLWFTVFLGTAAAHSSARPGTASTQTTEAAQLQPRQNQHSSAGFQPQDSREEAAEIPGLTGVCRDVHRDRPEGILCYSLHPGVTHHVFLPSKRTHKIK